MAKSVHRPKEMITRRSFMKGAACGSLGVVAGLSAFGRGKEAQPGHVPFAAAAIPGRRRQRPETRDERPVEDQDREIRLG